MQYIGVITCAICGILAAIAVPFAGFCVCCCRCAGKCGGYPEHFDKRGDACRRVSLGIFLSVFVIAAMFGVVSAFVTNQVNNALLINLSLFTNTIHINYLLLSNNPTRLMLFHGFI